MKNQTLNYCKIISLFVFCFTAIASASAQNGASAKPTLAVVEFETRPQISRDAGRELSEILVNELLETNRFTVVDRARTNKVVTEQRDVLVGLIDPAKGAEVGRMIGAQYLIIGSVTEFKEDKAGGFGPIGKILPTQISNKVANYRALVKFNLQVINSTTGEIAFSKPFEKDVKTAGLSGSGAVFDLPKFESKAMQDAVAQAMKDAVAALVEKLGSAASVNVASADNSSKNSTACTAFPGGKSPRIMVVIPEIHITQRIPDPAGETEIIKKLVANRYNVVDQKQVAAIRDREKVLTAIKNPRAAASLGVEFGADIIIIGEAFSELASRERNMISARARVEARAIKTDTAQILAADGKFGSGLDTAEFVAAKTALRNAGTQWADSFLAQMCQASPTLTATTPLTTSAAVSTTAIEIMISGVSFAQLKQFTDKLAKIPGVRSAEKVLTGNVARINVQFDGSGEKLADAISSTRFDPMRVNIVGLSGSKIEISVGR